ncbi:MAG: ABC transporter permease [Clostridiales bacterium]|nr:ABC transporter permease [Clostridiales bacterium]
MKMLLIAKSNMRKNRTATITLTILLMIATMMLYIGLGVIFQVNHFFDKKDQEINGTGFVVLSPEKQEKPLLKILKDMEGVSDIESQHVINYSWIPVKNLTKNNEAKAFSILMLNADDDIKYCKLNMTVSEIEQIPKENSIILPYYLSVSDGYQIGDRVELEIQGEKIEFEVYGFHEETLFSNPTNSGKVKCFVFEQKFQELYVANKGAYNQKLYKVKLTPGISTISFEEDFVKRVTQSNQFEDGSFAALNYDRMKEAAGLTLNLYMAILIVFAIIIVTVTVVIIRFTIVTHIEENIKSLGSMQAMGYTNREIKLSLLVQFLSISIIGYVLGLILSFIGRDIVNNLVSVTTGLMWENQINVLAASISFIVVILVVALITLQTVRRINKLNPITALRNGILTHNFQKNYLPLQKSPFHLNITVGLKGLFQNKKQNIAIGIISVLITFTYIFTLSLYQNFICENRIMISMVGLEESIQVTCKSENKQKIFDEISSMPEVAKTVQHETIDITLNYQNKQCSTVANICNDFDLLELNNVYRGRYPIHENEIVISSVVSKALGATIGDAVTIVYGDNTCDYLVVGLSQHVYQLGSSVSLTSQGMLRVNPEYSGSCLFVYNNDGIEPSDLINTIQNKYEEEGITCEDNEKLLNAMIETINQAILLFITIFIIVTTGVICITMHYLVKVRIIKEKTILGIHKSLGFTTKQVLGHTVIGFCPVVLIGSLLGGGLGAIFMNKIFSWMFSFTGISKANLQMPFQLFVIAVLSITILAVITTIISSLRIRKIQPCELFRA